MARAAEYTKVQEEPPGAAKAAARIAEGEPPDTGNNCPKPDNDGCSGGGGSGGRSGGGSGGRSSGGRDF